MVQFGIFADRGRMAHAQSLTAQETPSSGWRLNFADFAEVCRITYAKGVIGDGGDGSKAFYWIDNGVGSNPRVIMSSYVKVIGPWGISAFIELFYHPRPQYWDTNGTPATECNSGYFTHAFQGFRYGDEVKVLLQDGVPQAVMGFYDGIPRVGENIVKVAADFGTYLFGVFPINYSLSSPNGPDGSDLGATEKVNLLFDYIPPFMPTGYLEYEQRGYKLIVGPIFSVVIITKGKNNDGTYYRGISSYDSVGNYYPNLYNSIIDYNSAVAALSNNILFQRSNNQAYPSTLFIQDNLPSDWNWPDIYIRPHN